MKIDTAQSRYQEHPDNDAEFKRTEIKHGRTLLRRLRFLETQVRERGGLAAADSSGGGAFAEYEMDALEWALGPDGLAFITIKEG